MESHLPGDSLSAIADSFPPERDGPSVRASAEAGRGLYVHVPFCARRCDYCDFSTGTISGAAVERYLEALEREAARRAESAAGVAFTSGFLGRGTPSGLSARHFAAVGERGS